MHTRNLWPALLLVAAAACSEGGSPVDTPWERTFDIAVPTFRQLTPVSSEAVESQPVDTVAASYSYSPTDLPVGYSQVLAAGRLITEASSADAGFHSDYSAAFGQALGRSRGSYYKNTATLTLRYQGADIAQKTGETMESCLCAHFWAPWGQIANVTIGFQGDCGHLANVTSRHDAKLQFSWLGGMITLMAEENTDNAFAHQPPCGVSSGDNGGSGSDEDWYICFWEDVYSETGVFLRRVELGCSPYNGNVY